MTPTRPNPADPAQPPTLPSRSLPLPCSSSVSVATGAWMPPTTSPATTGEDKASTEASPPDISPASATSTRPLARSLPPLARSIFPTTAERHHRRLRVDSAATASRPPRRRARMPPLMSTPSTTPNGTSREASTPPNGTIPDAPRLLEHTATSLRLPVSHRVFPLPLS